MPKLTENSSDHVDEADQAHDSDGHRWMWRNFYFLSVRRIRMSMVFYLWTVVYRCRNYLLNRLRIQIFDSRSSLKDSVGNTG